MAIGLLAVATYAVANWAKPAKKSPRVTVSKATTRVTGPLTKKGYVDYAQEINQRLSVGVTAENNANVLLWKAMGPAPEQTELGPRILEAMKTEMLPKKGDYYLDLGTFCKQELKLNVTNPRWDKIFEQQGDGMFHPWSDQKYSALSAWLKYNEKPLAVVKEATMRPRYFSPLIIKPDSEADDVDASLVAALLPSVQLTRSFARALACRAMLHLKHGRHEQAWGDILTCHRLGRLVAKGPTLVDTLVGIAICAIASEATVTYIEHSQPDSQASTRHARELAEMLPLPKMVDHIDLCERFIFLDLVQRLAASEGNKFELLHKLSGSSGSEDPLYWKMIKSAANGLTDWDLVMKEGNTAYDQIVKGMRLEDPVARKAALDAFELSVEKRNKRLQNPLKMLARIGSAKSAADGLGSVMGDYIICLMMPALSNCQSAESRALQTNDNLVIALALSSYHSEHGKYPATLASLVPTHLKQLPIDRFSGNPLVYRPNGQGYIFYSVGQNKKDEQGRFYDDEPQGDDLRVQMPRKKKSQQD